MPALEASDVSMRRCGRSLVQRVSLTADRGELLALCGPEGSGTRTLLHLLSGHLLPDAGGCGSTAASADRAGARRRPTRVRLASGARGGDRAPRRAGRRRRSCCSNARPPGSSAADAHALLAAGPAPGRRGAAVVLAVDGPEPVAAHATTVALFVAGRLLSWGAPTVALVPAVHILSAAASWMPLRPAPSSPRRRSTRASPRRARTTGSAGGARRGSAWSRACSSTGRSTRRGRT